MNPNLREVSVATQFKPGNPGGPGRAVGSRTIFSAGFTRDLAEVWSEHGKATMVHTAKTNPTVFFATCARLIGPEVKVTIEQPLPGNLSLEDWALVLDIVEAVKVALPNAAQRQPHDVLALVSQALAATSLQHDDKKDDKSIA
jgi:hypothetical protein